MSRPRYQKLDPSEKRRRSLARQLRVVEGHLARLALEGQFLATTACTPGVRAQRQRTIERQRQRYEGRRAWLAGQLDGRWAVDRSER